MTIELFFKFANMVDFKIVLNLWFAFLDPDEIPKGVAISPHGSIFKLI